MRFLFHHRFFCGYDANNDAALASGHDIFWFVFFFLFICLFANMTFSSLQVNEMN